VVQGIFLWLTLVIEEQEWSATVLFHFLEVDLVEVVMTIRSPNEVSGCYRKIGRKVRLHTLLVLATRP